ncbi:transposase [Moorena sp. SIO4G3]|uniref:RNA-guided endonuclease InsQ/TnpB family protein n=1 Tax=Moorena sp. SIO4G3 TaxID=2607821 RepID=UPI0014293DC0|nr:transposase [Moorena sp. SIO4G3]NEO75470.1 IS200/IS605 family element transposase accessory protein TnpB [Moorena sp. SIO4G3]
MVKEQSYWGCQQNLISPEKELLAILKYICTESNKIYNCAVYYARQIWFKTKRIVGRAEICAQMKHNRHFTAMYVSASQQVCNGVAESFRSFQKLNKLFWTGFLDQRPKPPSYRKAGLFTVSYPKRWLKLVGEKIRLPLGRQVKTWFGLAEFFIDMPSNLDWASIKEVRILPRNGAFYAEFVYKMEPQKIDVNLTKALGVDHGIDNWLTCVDTLGNSFIVDGKHIKSMNQWYNKRVATLKEGHNETYWTKLLATITEKRNRQMREGINKAARIVINHCLEHRIGTIVFGWNEGQKIGANMGRKTNQKFVQIPTARLKKRIAQLCDLYGIQFIETEESYTSKASALDNDDIPVFGEKPDSWKPSGKRLKRGLYRTAQNWYVNADCNGAMNIIRKVAGTMGIDLMELSRGALTTPVRLRLWNSHESPRLKTRGVSNFVLFY